MKHLGPIASATGLVLALLLPACSSGGGEGSGGGQTGGGSMFIQSCSLGCTNGAGGRQVSCTVVESALNRELVVYFSQPVLASTVNSTTFQLIDVGNGQAPIGSRFLDPADPRKMIFRPSITFDNQGNASFGFLPNRTYRVTIPGTAHSDAGPFVQSTDGKPNSSRMQCDIRTNNQVDDLVPGPPVVRVRVDLADMSTPNDHTDFIADQNADGAVDVWRDSTIRFLFNDVMNPVSLVNPQTHQPSVITIEVDSDGNLNTTLDRSTLFGLCTLNIDLMHLTTEMIFRPSNGMPSAGEDPILHPRPRKVLVTIPPTVQDLAGVGISNSGPVSFTPEVIHYDPVTLPDADGENFTNLSNQDTANSGADWGGGRLAPGWGGGSGRLGSFKVEALETVVFETDGILFKNVSAQDPITSLQIVETTGILDNSRPTGTPAGYDPLDKLSWPTVIVRDGIFEFSSIHVDNGGVLRIVGTKPARLFSRGPVTINGVIDLRGESPAAHLSDEPLGEPWGEGGPNGGHGGNGADRPDNSAYGDILTIHPDFHGIENPGAITRGGRGMGVGRRGSLAGGKGGVNNPNPFPTSIFVGTAQERGGSLYSDISANGDGTSDCTIVQVASPGSGGGYALDGESGQPSTPWPEGLNPEPPPDTLSNLPNAATGGDSAELQLEPPDPESGHVARTLDAAGYLRGGSGGGGGGASLFGTDQQGNTPNDNCYTGFNALLTRYMDHSAGSGGGGGGALQLVSGALVHVAGNLNARGGNGSGTVNDALSPRTSRASPGGGGSGGAVRVQGRLVNIEHGIANPFHIDVTGGLGGTGLTPDGSGGSMSIGKGGDGGPGLVRIEDLSGGTSPPATLLSRCSEAKKVLPFDPDLFNPNTPPGHPCFGQAESEYILSVGPWSLPTRRPETFSASVSCWMRPPGNYFSLRLNEDDLGGSPAVYGWNMDVDYHLASGADVLTPYRGRDVNTPFSSGDFESNLGSEVNYLNASEPPGNDFGTGPFDPAATGTFMTVRFQGAQAVTDISLDRCNVIVMGFGSKIAPESLTPWVRHPAELNQFLPAVNMIRFCVVFDRSLATPGSVESNINGITNLRVSTQPD